MHFSSSDVYLAPLPNHSQLLQEGSNSDTTHSLSNLYESIYVALGIFQVQMCIYWVYTQRGYKDQLNEVNIIIK